MFEFVRKHTRLLQFILVLLIFPSFVMFGIQGYNRFSEGGNATVAKVGGENITQAEWDAAHRDQVERVRRQMPNVDPKLLDSPEMKRQTLDALVRERVMLAAADKQHLIIGNDRLQRLFVTDPQFAGIRNADGTVNKEILAAQGMSVTTFEARLRQDLSIRQVLQGIAGTAVAPIGSTSAALDAMFQQREVQIQRFDVKDYVAKVSPTDAEIEAYYKDATNAAQFQSSEQANIEYVVLDLESLKKGITVSDEDLRKYYTENEARYSTPEERRASHILIKADKNAPAAERDKAKAKAEALLADLKKPGAVFADLARKNSDDPGSADKGGDLDYFGRGAMVKPFEDAAFTLKPGETSALIETDFGYHIIRVTAARGGDKRSFDSVRAEIENEVKKQLAQRKYSEVAVEFTNMVYEQPDSLKPVVEKFKLELRTAKAVKRTPAGDASGALANAKFLEALFGKDALTQKRNTEAVEIGANQMVSGRVLEYSPARQLPLADVREMVLGRVVGTQAAALARKEGEARLAQLLQAPETTLSVPTQVVSRAQARDLPRQIVDATLKTPAAKLPAYAGVNLDGQGYAIVKLLKVLGRDPAVADATRSQEQYAQAWSDAESQAYYASLKTRFKVDTSAAATAAAAAASAAN